MVAAGWAGATFAVGQGADFREGYRLMTTLVLGIGNSLLTDDGAGVHAALRLAELLGDDPDVTVLDAGTLSFTLLHYVEGATSLIALDAARSGLEPGALSVHEGPEFDRFVQRNGRSVHEVGLADLIDMARLAGQLPAKRVLIGIEPLEVEWGLEPTPPVAAALPGCVALARQYVEQWRPARTHTQTHDGDPIHAV
jgi:hydrogenase maturation protease